VSHTDDDRAKSDGGVPSTDESPFDTVSDIQRSRWDRYHLALETSVFAPARIAWSDRRARVGAGICLFYFLMGTVGVVLVEPPAVNEGPTMLRPFVNWEYPLGTNNIGEGLMGRIIHATPPMLKMIGSGAVFTTGLAVLIGTVSGYKGGTTDRLLTTFTDILLTIPGLPLVIVVAVVLEPQNPYLVGIVLSVNAWAGLARKIRSQVLTLREEAYVEASRIMGIPTRRIITEDLIPNLMPYISVNFVQTGKNIIFASVGLYFLGILPFSTPNWGVMMNLAYTTGASLYTWQTAHWLIIPMVTIIGLSLGLILLAQGMDRLFNPRARARHSEAIADEEASAGTETN